MDNLVIKEGILIKILVFAIIVLVLVLGADMYFSFKIKKEVDIIDRDLTTLNEKKLQLISQRNSLEDSVDKLSKENTQLMADKIKQYQELSQELEKTQQDLKNCLSG